MAIDSEKSRNADFDKRKLLKDKNLSSKYDSKIFLSDLSRSKRIKSQYPQKNLNVHQNFIFRYQL